VKRKRGGDTGLNEEKLMPEGRRGEAFSPGGAPQHQKKPKRHSSSKGRKYRVSLLSSFPTEKRRGKLKWRRKGIGGGKSIKTLKEPVRIDDLGFWKKRRL